MKNRTLALILTFFSAIIFVSFAAAGERASASDSLAIENDQHALSAPSSTNRSGEQVRRQVMAAGGVVGSSANYRTQGTAGQLAIGTGTSANFGAGQGFWLQPPSGSQYVCGDADGSGIITISDAVFVINYIFAGGPAPSPLGAGDVDCNSIVTISDVVYLINYIFAGGPTPCAACL